MNVVVQADALKAIHDYLLTRPMREVEGMVAAIRQAVPAKVENTASDRMEEIRAG